MRTLGSVWEGLVCVGGNDIRRVDHFQRQQKNTYRRNTLTLDFVTSATKHTLITICHLSTFQKVCT